MCILPGALKNHWRIARAVKTGGRAHRCLGGRAGTEVAPGERVPKVTPEACRRGWEPGQGLFSRVTSAVPGLPTVHRAWKSPGGTIPDPPAHGVAAGAVHAPGVGQTRQQQLAGRGGNVRACPSARRLAAGAVPHAGSGNAGPACHSRTCWPPPSCRSWPLSLLPAGAHLGIGPPAGGSPGDDLRHRQGRVSHQEAGLGQHFVQAPAQAL